MTLNQFGDAEQGRMWREELCPGAVVLRGFAVPYETAIVAALHGITSQAPFRHMITPGGFHLTFRKAAVISTHAGCHRLEVGKP